MDCSGRNHYLKPRLGLLIADIFHVVTWLVLCICGFDVLEELRNVRIITEADECLGIMSCGADIVALVLPSELAVLLDIELGA